MTGRRRKPQPRAPRVIAAAVAAVAVIGTAALLVGPALRGGDAADPTGVPSVALSDRTPAPTGTLAAALVAPGQPGTVIGDALAAVDDLPGPAAPKPPRRPAPPRVSGPVEQVIDLINAERAQAGCPALTVDRRITAAAQGHSEDMAARGYFEHDSQDGRSFADRIADAGYPDPGAENIAKGQDDAPEVVRDWMNSSSHRRNIQDCSLRTTGVGLSDGYWTQDFGR